MANEDKKIVSLAMLQRFSYNFRDALNSVLDEKQDVLTFNPQISSGQTLTEISYMKEGQSYFYFPGSIYVYSQSIISGDEIQDTDLIAAFVRHQPLFINNLTLYYQATINGNIQYSNITYNGMNTVITVYLFNSTSHILTVRITNI